MEGRECSGLGLDPQRGVVMAYEVFRGAYLLLALVMAVQTASLAARVVAHRTAVSPPSPFPRVGIT